MTTTYRPIERPGSSPREPRPPSSPPEPAAPGTGQAALGRYTSNSIEVSVDASGGYLLFGELDYPGWRAEVDGQARPLLRADYALRAVPLRAGDREVRLVYEPESLRFGAALSLLALGVAAGLLAAPRIRRWRARGQAPR